MTRAPDQRHRRARLDQEGGFADARLAADQRRRSGHEAAAARPGPARRSQ